MGGRPGRADMVVGRRFVALASLTLCHLCAARSIIDALLPPLAPRFPPALDGLDGLPTAETLPAADAPIQPRRRAVGEMLRHLQQRPLARAHRPSRGALARRLLQNECDQNMTLVGSQCVCAPGFYDSASAPQLLVNGVDSVCLGLNIATDFAGACTAFVDPLGTPGVCGVSVSASDGFSPYTAVDYTLNGGPRILPASAGAPAWLQLDLEASRTVGGVSFKQWLNCPAGSTCAGAFRGFQVYIGNDASGYDAGSNALCYSNADNSNLAALNNGGTLSAPCLGTGRYVYIVAPPNTQPNEFTVMPVWHLQVFPPGSCNPITPCVECPAGHLSAAGSLSVGDCFFATGVVVNQTINFVDPNLNQSQFTDALPDYIQLLSYSEDQETFLENCPAGYYCLSDTVIPKPCPAGTYRDSPGANSLADCFPCPAGDYCPVSSPFATSCPAGTYRGTTGAGQPQDCSPCLAGNYCPMGSIDPTNCSAGTYRATTGASTIGDCLVCPAGRYCGLATQTPVSCPAGTFLDNSGGVVVADCMPCSQGSFCPLGSVTPAACPAGTYMSSFGAQALADCVTCPAGSFCPLQAVAPTQCPAGTFRTVTAGQSAADCSACPTGAFCPSGAVTPTQCPAGTYLNASSAVQLADCTPCVEGSYCPLGSTVPTSCPAGTYRDIASATGPSDCFACPSGQYCGVGTVSATSCLPGTYRATLGATTVNDCLPCPVGQYCPFATTTPLSCPAGTYLGATGGTDRSSCVLCPSGSYCPEQSSAPTACPAGNFRTATGATALSSCLACPAGQYCPLGTTTPTSCAPGTYRATEGASAAADCVPCPAGQYCLVRTVDPVDCNAGSYRGTAGATQQGDCTVCPTGNYCPQQAVDPTNCTAGTYRMSLGGRSAADCLPCPAGQYCPLANTNPFACQAGTFRVSTGAATQQDCSACPSGAYCPVSSTRPILCSAGFHRDTPRATHLANCLLCLPGTYSLDVGRSANCPVCPANFYCRTATMKQPCPSNTVSPAGSYSILKCKCEPGFSCTYYKQIQAIVTLNTTLYDFNNNVNGIQTSFLQAMGAAANVSASQVIINGVVDSTAPAARGGRRLFSVGSGIEALTVSENFAQLEARPFYDEGDDEVEMEEDDEERPAGRRLLSADAAAPPQAPRAQGVIHVFASVSGSGRLHALERHLAVRAPDLHIAHRWEQAHKVHARRQLSP